MWRRPVLLLHAQESSEQFMSHSFFRTSLLFVYSNVANVASVKIIDLPQVAFAGCRLSHRSPGTLGNHEDGSRRKCSKSAHLGGRADTPQSECVWLQSTAKVLD